jgi:hypothetical protein
MNQQQYERWRAFRAKGQLNYFFIEGVLKVGIPFKILTKLLVIFWDGLSWPKLNVLTVVGAFGDFLFSVVFYGICFTLMTWYWAEDEYLEYEQKLKEAKEEREEETKHPSVAKLA